VSRVFIVGASVAVACAEPWGGHPVGDCLHDVFMERRKHERRPRLALGFGGLLLRHFQYRTAATLPGQNAVRSLAGLLSRSLQPSAGMLLAFSP
jgi:hypothetical protein